MRCDGETRVGDGETRVGEGSSNEGSSDLSCVQRDAVRVRCLPLLCFRKGPHVDFVLTLVLIVSVVLARSRRYSTERNRSR